MKNQGLGKNSPVHLSLGKDNYEALIERHGQWVRWLQAIRCSCTLKNGRPDIQCRLCGGEGWQYRFQKTIEETLSLVVMDGIVVELPTSYSGATVLEAHDFKGGLFKEAGRYGRFVRLAGARTPAKGERFDLTIMKPLVKKLDRAIATYLGNGCFSLDGLSIVGAAGVASDKETNADIVSIGSLKNETQAIEYAVSTTRRNLAFATVAAAPAAGDVLAATDVEYIEPAFFVVTGQQYRESDARFLEMAQGDASMSFPESYKVGEGDIVTLLAATQVGKRIISRGGGDIDALPEFYIGSIPAIESGSAIYLPNVDYMLWGANKIRWLGSNRPAAGAAYFVFYEFNPTYRVVKEFPNVRSGENQNLPRRVALKLLSTYAERKAI